MRWIVPGLVFASALCGQQRVSLAGEWQVREERDGSPGRAITVPSAFETALGTSFDGVARYRRTLPLPAQRAARVRIEFAAVATRATVFCNDKPVGEHLGGWTPFRVDVTDALRWDGADVLEVQVDEKVGHNTQGFLPIVQPHFGGIWQDVTLCLDDAPTIDRIGLFVHGRYRPGGDPTGELAFRIASLRSGEASQCAIVLSVHDGAREVARTRLSGDSATGTFGVRDVAAWSPASPRRYTVRFELFAGDRACDVVERAVGFRDLRADGTRILWNDEPLQVRGLLHWGYSPPHLAPPADPAFWRPQLVAAKERGFNLLKCCLWVPPACVYDLADELGLLIWQEYPTWHPQMDQAHKQELLTEYGEFFAHDRNHPSVAFRSITCETGHGADLDVVKALYDACKAAVPATLVVDDSSWIGWQRISDFWDEHPYGNNSWWPGRLAEFANHIAKAGAKPLLLGECMAADTWVDAAAWRARHGDTAPYWRPSCWVAQQQAEQWLTREFGDATLRSLLPASLDFGMQNRKFQIEQLRLAMPDAGYVVSVARDVPNARMGFDDDLGRPKWPASAWSWHGDTMICLDLPWHGRALAADAAAPSVRIAHSGRGPLRGELRLWHDAQPGDARRQPVALAPGAVGEPVAAPFPEAVEAVRRVRVHAELTGSHPAQNHWDLWQLPPIAPGRSEVPHVDRLTPALLDQLVAGGTAILHAGDRPGSLRTLSLWFLRGAPFAPPHPLHRTVPADLLLDLTSFDLESTRVMPWANLRDEIDPILAFWETHDIPEVRFHLLAGDTRVGKGRLLVTTLRLEGALGAWLVQAFERHLLHGPAPRRELSAATIAAMKAQLTEKKIDLPTWRFRTDPQDEGRAANWHDLKTDVTTAAWRDLRAGSHWENQADDLKQYTGVAWYRVDVAVPADWQGQDARCVFDGVDDSFEAWLNGEPVGKFGDPVTKTTVWLERQVAELGTRLRAGAVNTLVLRVVDHAGAGGLWKPVFLTTGPASRQDPLLH